MDKFAQKVSSYIIHNNLPLAEKSVVVGLSGGADSVALLAVLCELGYRCVAVHCNYHLRGDESNRDETLARQICDQLGVKCVVNSYDVASLRAGSNKSVEMICRDLRYQAYADVATDFHINYYAVAHHREDRVETFFLNLLRGSGIRGLSSMRPVSGCTVRPLLDCSRAEIEEYLCRKKLHWAVDSTNACCDITRNRLRNKLLPMMDELFDGASDAVLRSIKILDENNSFYQRAICEEIQKYQLGKPYNYDLQLMDCECPDSELVLYEQLRKFGVSRTQISDMFRAALNSGGLFHAPGGDFRVDHGCLYQVADEPTDQDTTTVTLDGDIDHPAKISVRKISTDDFHPQLDPNVAYFDAKVLDHLHYWQLRHWLRGDRIVPFGHKRSMLVSDVFTKQKLSATQKAAAWLLTCDGEVVWIPAIRNSNFAIVDSSTTGIIRLELLEP